MTFPYLIALALLMPYQKIISKQFLFLILILNNLISVGLANDAIFSEELTQSIQLLSNEEDERLLIKVQNKILVDIVRAKKKIEISRLNYNPSEIEETEAKWSVFYKNIKNSLLLFDDLIVNIRQQKKANYNYDNISSMISKLLRSESKYLAIDIEEISEVISVLKLDDAQVNKEKLFKYQISLERHHKILSHLLQSLKEKKKLLNLVTLVSSQKKISIQQLISDISNIPSKKVHSLVEEQREILENIKEIKLSLGKDRDEYRLTTGDEHLVAGIMLRQNLENMFNLLDELVENYLEQKNQGFEIDKFKNFLTKFLTSESKYIRYDIQAEVDEVLKLRKTIRLSDKDLYTFQVAIGKHQLNLEISMKALKNNIQRLIKMEINPSNDIRYLNILLNRLANKLVIRLHIVTEEEDLLEDRLKGLEDIHGDTKDNLELELEIIKVRKVRIVNTTAKIIALMKKQNLDTSKYTILLIQETGSISQDLFDSKVLKKIVSYWFKYGIDWLKEHGSWLIFKILLLVSILFIAKFLSTLVGKTVSKAIHGSKLSLTYLLKEFIISASKTIVLFIGWLIALSQMGLEIAPLLTGLGIAGFIIGFALQDTLSNFASGIMILVYRPYDVNDLVEVGGFFGKVRQMNLVSTTILTPNNRRLIIPNNKIWGDVINNATAEHIRRIDLVFGIGYSDNMALAEKALLEVLEAHPLVLKKPEPTVKVQALSESSVDFVVRPWVKTQDYWDVHWDVTRLVKEKFDKENISIPFPQRDVHIQS